MPEVKPNIQILNTGLLPLAPGRKDFLAGAIPFELRIASGQWDEFISDSIDVQQRMGFEPMDCVSHSNCKIVQMQINWMITNNILKPGDPSYDFLKSNKYLDANGKCQLSERFLAKVSNTTYAGNGMQPVADAGRHYGYAPESAWPYPENPTWSEFYKPIPPAVLELASQWNNYFEPLQYEWIDVSDIPNALKHAPVQLGAAICGGWNDGNIIKKCNSAANHATSIYGYKDKEFYKDLDQYLDSDGDTMKKLAWNYSLQFLMKLVVNKKKIILSDPAAANMLKKNLRNYQIILVPDSNGEMYLADCSLGKDSWKFPINEFGLTAQIAKNRIAHGVTGAMASRIRTVDSLDDVINLYK